MKRTKVVSAIQRGINMYRNRDVIEAVTCIPTKQDFCKELRRISAIQIG